jgi:hypothetical protein
VLHHDQRPYRIAIDETAKKFQAELQAKIAASQSTAVALIDRIEREVPDDRIASTRALRFEPTTGGLVIGARSSDFHQAIHRHALSQVAERAGIPDLFVSRLLAKPWGARAARRNSEPDLRARGRAAAPASVGRGDVRGVLSDTYRRLYSRPIIEAFADACRQIGVVPIEGLGGELRFCIRAVLPIVFRPADEVLAFGIEISNSDFGAGALSVRCFCLRVWCTNYARLVEELRKVHLGKRLDDSIEFSRETYDLDTRAMSSAVRDIVVSSLSPAKVNAQVAQIERAISEKIDFKSALAGLPKMGLLKKEIEAVHDVLTSGGIEQLPPTGNTTYRLSNAISWIAKAAEPERRLDLEALAGSMLLGKSVREREVA